MPLPVARIQPLFKCVLRSLAACGEQRWIPTGSLCPRHMPSRGRGPTVRPLPEKGHLMPQMPARYLTCGSGTTYSGKDQRGGKETASPIGGGS